MKAARLLVLGLVLLASAAGRGAGEELPAAAKETLAAFENEVAGIQQKAEAEVRKASEKAVAQLKPLQDRFCKDARLDEAVAIRDQIRQLQGAGTSPSADSLPAAARETLAAFDKEVAQVQRRTEAEIKKAMAKAVDQLQQLQDRFCKDARLDEALAIRDQIRQMKLGVKAKPDPGYLHAEAADIGKVWYFEVVGTTQESTWGTDIYTTDSHLGTTAVHAGVLGVGQKGIVKVTILPGQQIYPSTTRNGVTSSPWGSWGISFKVERLPGQVAPVGKK